MTKLCSILLILLAGGVGAQAQPLTLQQLDKLRAELEKEGWGQKKAPPFDPAQVAAGWEARRRANSTSYEKIFNEFRAEVRGMLPRTFRMAMADRTLSFGALNLYMMFSRFEAVKVYPNYLEENPVQVNPHRDTDFYLADYQMAVLNRGFLFSEPARRRDILLHVFLGAAGYEDEDYQLTVALKSAELVLARDRSVNGVNFHSLFPQSEGDLYRKPTLMAGGFTGTNGGGEDSPAWVKTELLKWAAAAKEISIERNWPCKFAWSNPNTYIADIQELRIEANKDLLSIHGYRRVGPRSYHIVKLPVYSGGTDIFKGPSAARSVIVGIFTDACQAKYAPQGHSK